jgi:hypothetical protein
MSGAIPPLPQYVFMEWCLVKAQGKLYLYLVGLPHLLYARSENVKKIKVLNEVYILCHVHIFIR